MLRAGEAEAGFWIDRWEPTEGFAVGVTVSTVEEEVDGTGDGMTAETLLGLGDETLETFSVDQRILEG